MDLFKNNLKLIYILFIIQSYPIYPTTLIFNLSYQDFLEQYMVSTDAQYFTFSEEDIAEMETILEEKNQYQKMMKKRMRVEDLVNMNELKQERKVRRLLRKKRRKENRLCEVKIIENYF